MNTLQNNTKHGKTTSDASGSCDTEIKRSGFQTSADSCKSLNVAEGGDEAVKSMKLYLISQETVTGYDTYDSAVVAANSVAEARNCHPDGGTLKQYANGQERRSYLSDSWTNNVEDVTVQELGKAGPKIEAGVICASFNAG
jgi:hypothetical protein